MRFFKLIPAFRLLYEAVEALDPAKLSAAAKKIGTVLTELKDDSEAIINAVTKGDIDEAMANAVVLLTKVARLIAKIPPLISTSAVPGNENPEMLLLALSMAEHPIFEKEEEEEEEEAPTFIQGKENPPVGAVPIALIITIVFKLIDLIRERRKNSV